MDIEWGDKYTSLVNKGLIQELPGNKISINGKNRRYNPNKISKILTKTVNALYRKQYRKENKPERKIRNLKDKPSDSVEILLKRDIVGSIDDSRFQEFSDKHDEIQGRKQDPQKVEMKFRIELVREGTEMDPKTKKLKEIAEIKIVE